MTSREAEEYQALRATIRERGTVRIWTFSMGIMLWAALVLVTAALEIAQPIATLVPLLALTALFEAVFAFHTGVERIGRYLQVFYETDGEGDRRWEHAAMAFGNTTHVRLPDPLFASFFLLAATANLLPVLLLGALPIEWMALALLHVLFAVRVGLAKRAAASQRAADLARFQDIKNDGSRLAPKGS